MDFQFKRLVYKYRSRKENVLLKNFFFYVSEKFLGSGKDLFRPFRLFVLLDYLMILIVNVILKIGSF